MKRFDTYQVLAHPWVSGKAQISSINLSKSVSMNLKKHMGVDTKGSKPNALDAAAEAEEPASPAPTRAKKTAV